MAWMIGVDVGGTFTDFFAFDDTTDRIVLHKVPSTPANPAQAVIAGPARACRAPRHRPRRDHAALARHDRRHQRADPAARRQGRARRHRGLPRPDRDRAADPPACVQPAGRLSGAAGAARAALRGARAHHGGRQRDPRARRPTRCRRWCKAIGDAKPDACAVCLLFSFLNPAHEAMIRDALRAAYPDMYLSISSRGAAGIPRIRAALDHGAQRLSAAGDRPLSRRLRQGRGARPRRRPRSASTSRPAD